MNINQCDAYFKKLKTERMKQTCGNCEHSKKFDEHYVDCEKHTGEWILFGVNKQTCFFTPSRWNPKPEGKE